MGSIATPTRVDCNKHKLVRKLICRSDFTIKTLYSLKNSTTVTAVPRYLYKNVLMITYDFNLHNAGI
jgi:hypothetical protein